MKRFLLLFSTMFFLQFANAQFCPGNIFTNGDLELGDPDVTLDEDIGNAIGFSSIWNFAASGASGADFLGPTTAVSNFSLPTPASGNYAGFWVSNRFEATSITYREGFKNRLTTPILPNTGTYCLTFDLACMGGWGTAELGVYGITNNTNAFAPVPTGSHNPTNMNLYGAANTMHLADIGINSNPCNGAKTVQTIIFNSSDPAFPAGGITHLFFTHSDNVISGVRYVGIDNLCFKGVPCGSIINETVVCAPGGGYNYTFEVENTSGLTVDGIDITIPGLGYDPSAVIPNGTTYGPVTVFIPANEFPTYCFDVLMYSGITQCCDIAHCIDLPDCDPCDDVQLWVNNVGADGNDCCYEIDVSNNFNGSYFTGINTTILTPGVGFSNPTTNGNWTVLPLGANTLNWSPPTPFMAQVSYLNPINFCFTDILQTSQMPQTVVFDWLALDSNGRDSVVCSDTLIFNCEPCLMIYNKEINCLDDGTYEYCFSVTNNGDDPATQLYLDPYGPSGATFAPNPVPVSLAPGQTSDYCVNISGVSGGDVVEYKALLKSFLGDTLNWCCIVDTFRVEIPECDDCVCDEKFFSSTMGFLPLYSINSCKGALSPFGIDECYEVTWRRNGVVIGQTMGSDPLYVTFSSKYASYCMTVSIPGTECVRQFCRKLRCNLLTDGPGDGPGGGPDLSLKMTQEDDQKESVTIKNIYPNPVNDLLNVNLNQSFSEARVNLQIINAMGEIVLALNNQIVNGEEIQVRVNDLSEGVYFLRIDGENIQSDFLKFVKVK
ncbi:MAG: T9SS type A sorting domain-containing protein [Saprospiraceae bacterium]